MSSELCNLTVNELVKKAGVRWVSKRKIILPNSQLLVPAVDAEKFGGMIGFTTANEGTYTFHLLPVGGSNGPGGITEFTVTVSHGFPKVRARLEGDRVIISIDENPPYIDRYIVVGFGCPAEFFSERDMDCTSYVMVGVADVSASSGEAVIDIREIFSTTPFKEGTAVLPAFAKINIYGVPKAFGSHSDDAIEALKYAFAVRMLTALEPSMERVLKTLRAALSPVLKELDESGSDEAEEKAKQIKSALDSLSNVLTRVSNDIKVMDSLADDVLSFIPLFGPLLENDLIYYNLELPEVVPAANEAVVSYPKSQMPVYFDEKSLKAFVEGFMSAYEGYARIASLRAENGKLVVDDKVFNAYMSDARYAALKDDFGDGGLPSAIAAIKDAIVNAVNSAASVIGGAASSVIDTVAETVKKLLGGVASVLNIATSNDVPELVPNVRYYDIKGVPLFNGLSYAITGFMEDFSEIRVVGEYNEEGRSRIVLPADFKKEYEDRYAKGIKKVSVRISGLFKQPLDASLRKYLKLTKTDEGAYYPDFGDVLVPTIVEVDVDALASDYKLDLKTSDEALSAIARMSGAGTPIGFVFSAYIGNRRVDFIVPIGASALLPRSIADRSPTELDVSLLVADTSFTFFSESPTVTIAPAVTSSANRGVSAVVTDWKFVRMSESGFGVALLGAASVASSGAIIAFKAHTNGAVLTRGGSQRETAVPMTIEIPGKKGTESVLTVYGQQALVDVDALEHAVSGLVGSDVKIQFILVELVPNFNAYPLASDKSRYAKVITYSSLPAITGFNMVEAKTSKYFVTFRAGGSSKLDVTLKPLVFSGGSYVEKKSKAATVHFELSNEVESFNAEFVVCTSTSECNGVDETVSEDGEVTVTVKPNSFPKIGVVFDGVKADGVRFDALTASNQKLFFIPVLSKIASALYPYVKALKVVTKWEMDSSGRYVASYNIVNPLCTGNEGTCTVNVMGVNVTLDVPSLAALAQAIALRYYGLEALGLRPGKTNAFTTDKGLVYARLTDAVAEASYGDIEDSLYFASVMNSIASELKNLGVEPSLIGGESAGGSAFTFIPSLLVTQPPTMASMSFDPSSGRLTISLDHALKHETLSFAFTFKSGVGVASSRVELRFDDFSEKGLDRLDINLDDLAVLAVLNSDADLAGLEVPELTFMGITIKSKRLIDAVKEVLLSAWKNGMSLASSEVRLAIRDAIMSAVANAGKGLSPSAWAHYYLLTEIGKAPYKEVVISPAHFYFNGNFISNASASGPVTVGGLPAYFEKASGMNVDKAYSAVVNASEAVDKHVKSKGLDAMVKGFFSDASSRLGPVDFALLYFSRPVKGQEAISGASNNDVWLFSNAHVIDLMPLLVKPKKGLTEDDVKRAVASGNWLSLFDIAGAERNIIYVGLEYVVPYFSGGADYNVTYRISVNSPKYPYLVSAVRKIAVGNDPSNMVYAVSDDYDVNRPYTYEVKLGDRVLLRAVQSDTASEGEVAIPKPLSAPIVLKVVPSYSAYVYHPLTTEGELVIEFEPVDVKLDIDVSDVYESIKAVVVYNSAVTGEADLSLSAFSGRVTRPALRLDKRSFLSHAVYSLQVTAVAKGGKVVADGHVLEEASVPVSVDLAALKPAAASASYLVSTSEEVNGKAWKVVRTSDSAKNVWNFTLKWDPESREGAVTVFEPIVSVVYNAARKVIELSATGVPSNFLDGFIVTLFYDAEMNSGTTGLVENELKFGPDELMPYAVQAIPSVLGVPVVDAVVTVTAPPAQAKLNYDDSANEVHVNISNVSTSDVFKVVVKALGSEPWTIEKCLRASHIDENGNVVIQGRLSEKVSVGGKPIAVWAGVYDVYGRLIEGKFLKMPSAEAYSTDKGLVVINRAGNTVLGVTDSDVSEAERLLSELAKFAGSTQYALKYVSVGNVSPFEVLKKQGMTLEDVESMFGAYEESGKPVDEFIKSYKVKSGTLYDVLRRYYSYPEDAFLFAYETYRLLKEQGVAFSTLDELNDYATLILAAKGSTGLSDFVFNAYVNGAKDVLSAHGIKEVSTDPIAVLSEDSAIVVTAAGYREVKPASGVKVENGMSTSEPCSSLLRRKMLKYVFEVPPEWLELVNKYGVYILAGLVLLMLLKK